MAVSILGAELCSRPAKHCVKTNADAAIYIQKFQFGLGAGPIIIWVSFCSSGAGCKARVVFPKLAGIMGLKEVLSWIKSSPWNQVFTELHSLLVVQSVRISIVMNSSFGYLYMIVEFFSQNYLMIMFLFLNNLKIVRLTYIV